MKKILYIVLDGLGDLPTPQIGNKTPLEAASTPNMDMLAKKSKAGSVYTVGKGIAPESDIAVISILGYDAHRYYTGRGPLESYAEGLKVDDGDLAFRVNFATMEDGNSDKIKDRRVGRNLTTEEATALADEINKGVKLDLPATFSFRNTIGHRGILVIYGGGRKLSGEVTNTDPAYAKEGAFGVALPEFDKILLKAEPTEEFAKDQAAILSAQLTNEFTKKSRALLNKSKVNKKRTSEGKLPANVILSRDAGSSLPKFESMNNLFDMKFGCFVEMPVEKGIALLTGMDIVSIPLPSGDLEKDYGFRADKVIEAMNAYDGLYIHLKGPDEPAHDGDIDGKIASIEAIDKFFFGKLLPKIDLKNTVIAVTADHSTPCIMKAHSDDPVPLMAATEGIDFDGISSYSEKSVKSGTIGEIEGVDIMPLLVKLAKS
ncbi:MAG: 2,3-bisphosphoglycerate-independent phosphoglycerate mutase [Candidatus Omnitrophota bacterium]